MSPKTATKVAKLTYHDRVLAALAKMQWESANLGVHLQTLRAQIQKDATAADPLGGKWSAYVLRAIAQLEGDGVLSFADDHIYLANQGESIISRSLPSAKATNADEGASKQPTDAALPKKRRRTTSNAATPTPSKRSKTTAVDTPAPVLPSATPAKRPRGRPPRKSSIKFSLPARDESPLTDAEADYIQENQRLREQLNETQESLTALRRRVDEGAPNRPAAGEATPVAAQSSSRRFLASGLARTQPGSIIPNLSKQPTPAPSDGAQTDPVDDIQQIMPSPDATPSPGTHARNMTSLSTRSIRTVHPQDEFINASITLAEEQIRAARDVLAVRIEALEVEVNKRDTDLETLAADAQRKDVEASAEITKLKEDIEKLELDLQELRTAKASVDKEVATERTRADSLKEKLVEANAELEQTRDDLAGAQAELVGAQAELVGAQAELVGAQTELAGAQAELVGATTEVQTRDQTITELRAEAQALEAQLGQAIHQIGNLDAVCQTSQATIQDLTAQAEDLRTELSHRAAQVVVLAAELEQSRSETSTQAEARLRAENEVAQTATAIAGLELGLEEARAKNAGLREDLAARDKTIAELTKKHGSAVKKIAELESTLAAEQAARAQDHEGHLAAMSAESARVAELGAELEAEKRKANDLDTEKAEVVAENVAFHAEARQLRTELDAEKLRTGALEQDLLAQAAATQKAQDVVARLEQVKARYEGELGAHRTAFGALRRAQRAAVEQYEAATTPHTRAEAQQTTLA